MPEAQLTEPLDRAAEKGGLEEKFAALEAAVKADVEAFLKRGNVNAQPWVCTPRRCRPACCGW